MQGLEHTPAQIQNILNKAKRPATATSAETQSLPDPRVDGVSLHHIHMTIVSGLVYTSEIKTQKER